MRATFIRNALIKVALVRLPDFTFSVAARRL
jgi:hypothetical protein